MRRCWLPLMLAVLPCVGCGMNQPSPPPAATPVDQPAPIPESLAPLAFVAQELSFVYQRGETGAAWPVEVTGGGVALRDFDGDGDLDLFFTQGGPLEGQDRGQSHDVLLRNDGDRRFVDVSSQWGLTAKGYGQGVTTADYDGDGDTDVYVTRYGPNTLWRNDGGRFVDATTEAGVGDPLWSLGAAFFDADGDSDLDLFVANYFDFDESAAPFARSADGTAEYGTPATFAGQPDRLYRNEGGGRFVDATAEAGIAGEGRGMGVLAADLDGDHRLDILVANDAEANALWRNLGAGRFENIASSVGLDLNAEGHAEANMGIAHGDTDGDSVPDIIISHFVGEHDTLWRARAIASGGRFYQEETYAAGLGSASKPFTGWGITLADFDLDGRLDLVITNGQIRREPNQSYPYENPPLLWHGVQGGRFVDATTAAGPYFQALHMGRGLAAGDLDDDGDLDLVITHHDAPAVVLWNESPRRGRWLKLDLRGRSPNTDAIGAEAIVEASGRTFVRSVDGGGGYLSANDRRLHFGLGELERIDRVVVRWPSGRFTEHADVEPDRAIRMEEPHE